MKKLFLLVTITFLVMSCSSDDNDLGNDQNQDQDQNAGGDDDDPIAVENAVRLVTDATFGSVLTNSEGFTLYFFAPDSKGDSNCLDGCATTWPAFNTTELTLDSGLNAADFGTITRTDGGEQTTYKGWPLYTFSNDASPGDINGDGAGGTWFVAKPDYSVMFTRSQLIGRDSNGVETNLNSSFEPGDEETFYITDDEGNTLYHFSNDENGTNNFTAADFSNNEVWPIFHTELLNVPSILNLGGFGVIDVFGQPQLTYKGWPLYKFGGDENRGDNFGVGFPVAGVWPILNLDTENAPEPVVVENNVRLVTDATFGSVLTNSEGFTLYFFAPDSKGDSNCLDGCATTWPAFNTTELTLDSGLNAADFGTITRTDGGEQTTYKGWPLYTFSNDASPGDINGDGAGGTWFVAKPDYSVMFTRSQLIGRDSNGVETNLNSSFEPGDEETFYITDDEGNTLYHFSNDENGTNNFTAADFSNNEVWPIFHTELLNVPSILNLGGFGVIDVFGQPQLTYKGWPLYKFGGDENRGDNFGVGFPVAGVWPILNLDTENAPEPQSSTTVYEVGNQGASAYIFSGEGLTNAVNPDFTLKRGETYEFNVNTLGHPFIIKSVQSTGTGNAFNEGVTNNGISIGTITFTVPIDAPDTLFYNCEFHGSMTGVFTIID
ncbi:hypothetical protein [Croceitalea rosinachiae]|uniref:Secreted repeat protein with Y-X4-D motif n=1 Tax=Croceitalea rosinachiae TaxID=3075596 RepID=A0ABU3AFW7_9FLAO|nr:hypothetical protein [Croceitalea sp. F388]MDT0607771.1 hypothetical protein [Croceitalea sp. F388]